MERQNHSRWKGGKYIGQNGYVQIATGPGKHKSEHTLIVEKALGKPLPRKSVVHHVDENRTNNLNHNLVICPNQKYHTLLHIRMRTKKLGGNPNIDKRCSVCLSIHPKTEFYKDNRCGDGLRATCKSCMKNYSKIH